MKLNFEQVNQEVILAKTPIVTIGEAEVNLLKGMVMRAKRKTVRICMHKSTGNAVQEMLILHSRETYIRPHKHPGKSVSYHIVEGNMDMVLFDEHGAIVDAVPLGEYGSRRNFYYRLEEDFYYLPFVKSDFLLFHETIRGPFKKSDTVFAPWAAEDDDVAGAAQFRKELILKINAFKQGVPTT